MKKLLEIWYRMTFRRKMYVIIVGVGIVMALSTFVTLKVTSFFIGNTRMIMDDNFTCYRFQDALSSEARLFESYMRVRNLENEDKYKKACEETKRCLSALPRDYEKIGKSRYAVTWSIQNSYPEYEKQRERVIAMESDEPNYVKELYKTYSMQRYLDSYAARLTGTVLTEGDAYYESQTPVLMRMPYLLITISFLAFLTMLFILRFVTGGVVKALTQMAAASRKIEVNDFSATDIHWQGRDEIGQLVNAFNKMKQATKHYVAATEEKRQMEEKLHQEEMERTELEQRFSMAQLQLIKSQLNPHFLFNTLNMITRTAQIEEAFVTEEMLVAISNLLRYSLRTTNAFAPLEQELKVVSDYLYIQKMRFGERIRWSIDCDEQLFQEELPVFLLQPLVENAVIHGISEQESGGLITVRIKEKEGGMWISVADTGVGILPERLEEIRQAIQTKGTGLGIGMGNLSRRILAYYETGQVMIDSRVGCGTVVQIEFGERNV